MELTAHNVHQTFATCLFKEGEPTDNHVAGEGIQMTIGFHPDRLAEQKPAIGAMLDQLPGEFKKLGGGGWSFLNMCNRADGQQWADEHQTVEELVCLGMATEQLKMMPREMWPILPGGMPYLTIQ